MANTNELLTVSERIEALQNEIKKGVLEIAELAKCDISEIEIIKNEQGDYEVFTAVN
jgi:hypothetical protein